MSVPPFPLTPLSPPLHELVFFFSLLGSSCQILQLEPVALVAVNLVAEWFEVGDLIRRAAAAVPIHTCGDVWRFGMFGASCCDSHVHSSCTDSTSGFIAASSLYVCFCS
jgi:hypothetical protein